MDLILQFWGGGFYLANKVLLALSESLPENVQRRMKISAWTAYIIGVPAWLVVLIEKDNWIAASIEAGGVPAMFLGLYNAYHSNQKANFLFSKIVSFFTYGSLVFGISYSLYRHGGISSSSQILEVGVTIGFLLGSYYLAHGKTLGWLYFMLMNLSMASLMLMDGKYVLMVQQLFSFCFVVYGYKFAMIKEAKL